MGRLDVGLLVVVLAAGGCAARQKKAPGPPATPPGAIPLLTAIAPIPTEVLRERERREDIEIRPTNFDLVPSVVTRSTTPEIVIGSDIRATLAGDAAGTQGWSVDNVLLFEVAGRDGKVFDRFVIGFLTGQIFMGSELVDNVGSWSPRFDPKTPDLSLRLPRGKPITLSVTVLDNGNAGAVSDVFLVLEQTEPMQNELRDDEDASPF